MKLNLLLDNEAGCIPDALNLDPMASQGQKTVLCDITILDEYVEDGEADEIVARNILSYFDAGRVTEIISQWVKKTARGGSLTISDVDIVQAWKAYNRAELNFIELNHCLYGEQQRPWMFRKVGLCLQEVCEALLACGMEVVEKKLYSVLFEIKAVKP